MKVKIGSIYMFMTDEVSVVYDSNDLLDICILECELAYTQLHNDDSLIIEYEKR